MWLIGGRTPALAAYRRMWEESMESMIAVLVRMHRIATHTMMMHVSVTFALC
jgi:hypothetical protein